MTAQREWQQRQRDAGNCRRCGKPAAVNAAGKPKTYCADCAAAVNRRQRERYAARRNAAPDGVLRRAFRRVLGR